MGTALIYYYYSTGRTTWDDLLLPVIQSIATFRYWNKECAVWVLDVSEQDNDWGEYPEVLQFNIHRTDHHLKLINFVHERMPWTSPHLLSKPGNVYNLATTLPEDTFLVVDVDVFFLKQPDPLLLSATDKFTGSTNAGYWLFNKKNEDAEVLFDLWQSHCAQGMLDPRFREKAYRETNRTFMQEETILCYLMRHFPDLFSKNDENNNVSIRDVAVGKVDVSAIKTLHVHNCNCLAYPRERGMAALCIKEVRECVEAMLGTDRTKTMYAGREVEPFSLSDTAKVYEFVTGEKR